MQQLSDIRNISIIAHIDAGKTSTTEGMLFYSGRTHRIGNIDDGTTVMDYLPEERERGITIIAAAASFPWEGHLMHLIDTPGHIDFTAEVERSLRVIDGAVVIFSGVEGVEAQSEKVWHQAEKYKVPKIAFINKLDRIGADFDRVLSEINTKFGDCAVPVQLPVGIEGDFCSMIDLVELRLLSFQGKDNENVIASAIPDELQSDAATWRERLIERLADASDEITELYLNGDEIPLELIQKVIRKLTVTNQIVPVFVGSAKRRIGVQPLMDGVIAYLPSPGDCPDIPAFNLKDSQPLTLKPDPAAPFAGFIFKLTASTSADLLYLRTYAGTLEKDAKLINPRTGEKVRVKQILRLYAKDTEQMDRVGPGDIVGLIGPRDCFTGDTICEVHKPVYFERITFPEPVVSVAVEPRYSRDKERLEDAMALLCREDPTLAMSVAEDTGQRIFSGMGELHLEINFNRIINELKVESRFGEPRVAYRETLLKQLRETAVFQRMLGDSEFFAEVEVDFSPLPPGAQPFAISTSLRDEQQLPKKFVAAAKKALEDALRTGGNHGYPLIYVAANLRRLVIDEQKTTEGAITGAILQAVNQVIKSAGTAVLEPVMRLEIIAPDTVIGEITAYLQPRRAVIREMAQLNLGKRIDCEVPLAEMFGFGKALPKLSGGRASFSMEPHGFQEVSSEAAARLFGIS